MAIFNSLALKADELGQCKSSSEGRATMRQRDWIRGWWEHIGPEPVFIRDKQHLKQVCQAESRRTGRIIIPRAFAKPKSDGRGIEWTF